MFWRLKCSRHGFCQKESKEVTFNECGRHCSGSSAATAAIIGSSNVVIGPTAFAVACDLVVVAVVVVDVAAVVVVVVS